MDAKRLLQAQLIVGLLAVGAVVLFLLIYGGMGDSTPISTRLFSALCVPPLILLVVVGGYFLVRRR